MRSQEASGLLTAMLLLIPVESGAASGNHPKRATAQLSKRNVLLAVVCGVLVSLPIAFFGAPPGMPFLVVWKIPWLGEHVAQAVEWLLKPSGNEGILTPVFSVCAPEAVVGDVLCAFLAWGLVRPRRLAVIFFLSALGTQLGVFLGVAFLL